ncbi:MAG TPA: FG-GAP-like repeat-containing protein [Pyrinomonadaceae bacterium]|jgi:uncharacterized delta-60 repeat protein
MLRRFSRPFVLIFVFLFLSAIPARPQQPDATFGNNGITGFSFFGFNPFGGNSTEAVKAFLLPDGKYLVVAHHRYDGPKTGTSHISYIVRRNAAGAADGSQGSTTGAIGSEGNFVATDAAMQPDGKIVVVGYRFQNQPMEQIQDWKIVRFNPDGSHDSTFGTNGVIVRGFGENLDFATNVELQANGKIVVSGYSSTGFGTTVTVVARYNPDGSPDAPFGPYGEGFFVSYDNGYLSKKLAVQPDGKILLAGDSYIPYPPAASDVFLARFNPTGAVDTGFGSGGYVTLNYHPQDILKDFALLPDGKMLLLLDSIFPAPGTNNYVEQQSILIRFLSNGLRDSSFGTNSEVLINTSPPTLDDGGFPPFPLSGFETAQSIAVRANGNILISGIRRELVASSTGFMYSILEYGANGRFIAKNFSRRTRSNQLISTSIINFVRGSFEQPDGKIFLYGGVISAALLRYVSVSAVNNANNFFDYDFNGRDELAMYRPNNSGLGTWFFTNRSNQSFERQYGAAGDQIVPGDYDGDGWQDLAVFRPTTGEWITRKIYLDVCAPMDCAETVQFGANGDIPAPGDFDGDGKFDRAVFRPSGGDWYILFSSTGNYTGLHFGQNGDKPVVGDYDGDGKSDIAVIRRENGYLFWYISQSSDGAFVALQFGITEDKTVVADYNGDGKTEIAVWRPSNGTWYTLADYTDFSYLQFGTSGDIPEPIDYDGDRKTDWAVFRPSSAVHYILQTTDGSFVGRTLGAATDTPVASAYVR